MPDICDLILEDHETLRRGFSALDEHGTRDPVALAERWAPVAALLELHAAAEEAVFYPRLVKRGADGTDETLDALKDHNTIRDAVAAASRAVAGSPQWWEAVNRARDENEDHMGEEERDGIPDFRAHADPATSARLGADYETFKHQHDAGRLDVVDEDPEVYVAEHAD